MSYNEKKETEARDCRLVADAYAKTSTIGYGENVTHFYQASRSLAYFMVSGRNGNGNGTLFQVHFDATQRSYSIGVASVISSEMRAVIQMVKEFCAVDVMKSEKRSV